MKRRFTGVVALGLAALLAFSACLGGGDKKSVSQADGKPIRTSSFEPGTVILPGMVRDAGGSDILGRIGAGLLTYDPDGKIVMEAAESIETQDNVNWTVKLKKDWKFSNGEPVDARSFVDAWNYIAKVSNGQANRDGLTYIDGFTKEGDTDLSGLKVVDDYTFTIKLNTPINDFAERLSDTTFLPLPASAFKDMQAYTKNPIGAGPYILEDRKHQIGYKLRRNPDYKGYWKPAHPGLEVTIYPKREAAYTDYLAGNLDIIGVPSASLISFKEDSEKRYLVAESSNQTILPISSKTPGFGFDEAGKLRRKAVSMAINREEIADKIFKGLQTPANALLPPKLYPQYANLPGSEVLKFNPQKAKELWAQAEAISPLTKEEIKYSYNSDGGHKDWVEAVVYQLRENLGFDNLVATPLPSFSEFLKVVGKKANYSGFIRFGRNYGIRQPGNFELVYASGGQYNLALYDNPEVDRLIKEGVTVPIAQANDIWVKVQKILLQDLPVIPLFNGVNVYVYGKEMDKQSIQLNVMGNLVVSRLVRK